MSTYVKRNGRYKNVRRKEIEYLEFRETNSAMRMKCRELGRKMRRARCVTVMTGAGVSTAAGVRDYRTGISTMTRPGAGTRAPKLAKKLLKKRALHQHVFGQRLALAADLQMKKHTIVQASDAAPTLTHMGLVSLFNRDLVRYVVTTNIDGLHRRSGFPNAQVVELQGDPYIERCTMCGNIFVRDFHVGETLASRFKRRPREHLTGRKCRMDNCNKGWLEDLVVQEGEPVAPEVFSDAASMVLESDLIIVMGSSLREQPLRALLQKVQSAEVVIINLMKTPLDHLSDLRIFGDCDEVMSLLLQEQDPPLAPPTFQITRHVRIGNTYVKPNSAEFDHAPDLSAPLFPHADVYCEVMDNDGVIVSSIEQLELDLPPEYKMYGATHVTVGVGQKDLRQERNCGTVFYRVEPALYAGVVGVKVQIRPRFGEPPLYFSHDLFLNEPGSFRTYKIIYDVYTGTYSQPEIVESSHSRFSMSRMSSAGASSSAGTDYYGSTSLPSLHSGSNEEGSVRVKTSESQYFPTTPLRTPATTGAESLSGGEEQWPPARPYSGQQLLQSRSGLSSGGSSFAIRPLTGDVRPMTGVSLPRPYSVASEGIDANVPPCSPIVGVRQNSTGKKSRGSDGLSAGRVGTTSRNSSRVVKDSFRQPGWAGPVDGKRAPPSRSELLSSDSNFFSKFKPLTGSGNILVIPGAVRPMTGTRPATGQQSII